MSEALDAAAVRARDRADDRRLMVLSISGMGFVFALAASTQSVLVLGISTPWVGGGEAEQAAALVLRAVVNVVTVVFAIVVATALRIQERGSAGRAALVLVVAVSTALARVGMQLGLGFFPASNTAAVLTEVSTGLVVAVLVLAAGLALVDNRRRLRETERARARQALRATEALESLQREELRVRREVAEGIHGSVQNLFVVMAAELADIASRVPEPEARRLGEVARRLDTLREEELRTLSSVLYPVDIERGAIPAIRALVSRLPASIGVELDIADDVRAAESSASGPLPVERRVLLVRVLEEGISNALRHGGATRLRLQLRAAGDPGDGGIRVALDDDGVGLGEGDGAASGLARLREQLDLYGGSLELGPSPLGGARLAATVPA